MTEAASAVVAAPAAAPSAPNVSNEAPPQGGQQAAPAPIEGSQAAQRIELQKLPPNARVVLVVDGEEVEMSAGDAAKRIGRGESANKRYSEAAEMRRQHAAEKAEFEAYQRQFAESLSNPDRLRREFAALGMNPRQIAQALIQAEEADAALSPAERKLREYEEREQARTQQEKQQQAQAYQAEVKQHRESYATGFNGVMTQMGIPADHVMRDVLMPSLARAAQYIRSNEGREMTRGDCKRVIEHVIGQTSTLRPMTDEQRRSQITDADYQAWMESKRAQRPQASPAVGRDQQGRFVPQSDQPQSQRSNANGERVVSSLGSVWGDKM